ncbi:MAG: protein-L-isoaspartate O-methyltransferase [Alphaproteobacteria bacterium]|nr:protein-L-isoaspartate O-methyltransferase [Alphaproteobacteria bacterium]
MSSAASMQSQNHTTRNDSAAVRRVMVDCQLRTFGVTDLAVLDAVDSLPRECFVPASQRARAYGDTTIFIEAAGERRALLPPMIEARMAQGAGPVNGAKALVIGAATGYAAAILARLGANVTLLETAACANAARDALQQAGVAGVDIVSGDMAAGQPARAPYDLIFIAGACEEIAPGLLGQLAAGGKLIAIRKAGAGPTGQAVCIERSTGGFSETVLFDAQAHVLPGMSRKPAFSF